MLENVLICPKTQGKITIEAADCIAKVERSDIAYPIKDGIIDFLPDTVNRVTKAYDSFAPFYDEHECLVKFGEEFNIHYTTSLKSLFCFEISKK